MRMIFLIKKKRILFALTIMVILLSAVAPKPGPAAVNNPFTFTVGQVFTSSSPSVNASFTYRFQPLTSASPLPAGSPAEGYPFSIDGSGSAAIGPLNYTQIGIYEYNLFQVITLERSGYTYDRRVFRIKVYVDEELNVSMVAFNDKGTKMAEIGFNNSYHSGSSEKPVDPSDPELIVDPPVRKKVLGEPVDNREFTFKLVAREPDYPMPEGSVNGEKLLRIVGSGEGEFGKWSYPRAGVYSYTVYEVNDGAQGYLYDPAVYTITDRVRQENGKLVWTRLISDERNNPVTSLDFVNTYHGEVEPPEIVVPPAPIAPPGPTNPPSYLDLLGPVWPPRNMTLFKPDGPRGKMELADPGGLPRNLDSNGKDPRTGDNPYLLLYGALALLSGITAISVKKNHK